MRLIIVDNFDSFTYNLVHYFEQLVEEVHVVTNLEVEVNSLKQYDGVVLSPGPGLPQSSGRLMEVVAFCNQNKVPLLGVCLGMQAMALFQGNELYNQEEVKHGLQELVRQEKPNTLFKNLQSTFEVGLYHSWAVRLNSNQDFKAIAYAESGVLMAIENSKKKQFAVQFHPESILTPCGFQILSNFVDTLK